MSGWNAAFDTIATGTLSGRWPDIGLWAVLIHIKDRNGLIDCTPKYLSSILGLPEQEVLECIDRFMAPDPYSRTTDHEGRRLELINPARPWGWRVLNHSQYRERARKQQYDQQRTESGRDADRKRAQRGADPDVPTRPAMSRDVPLSYSYSEANAEAEKEGHQSVTAEGAQGENGADAPDGRPPTNSGRQSKPSSATRLPADWQLTPERRAVAVAERIDPERTHAKFCDHWKAADGSKARKRDWDAAWRNWCRTEADMARGPAAAPKQSHGERTKREFLDRMTDRDRREAADAQR